VLTSVSAGWSVKTGMPESSVVIGAEPVSVGVSEMLDVGTLVGAGVGVGVVFVELPPVEHFTIRQIRIKASKAKMIILWTR